ncbi:MAG: hypothetical protein WC334_03740 [Kiritimatiellales bacterium]|jgi:hypothetical protein
METFVGIIIGRLAGLFDELFSHWIIDRSSGKKVRKEKFRTALDELETELHRLLTRIDSPDFAKVGFESWSSNLLERKWNAVRQYLKKEAAATVSCDAQNAIGCLGSGVELRQWMGARLTDFLNKVIWLIKTADDVYDAGTKGRKKRRDQE